LRKIQQPQYPLYRVNDTAILYVLFSSRNSLALTKQKTILKLGGFGKNTTDNMKRPSRKNIKNTSLPLTTQKTILKLGALAKTQTTI